jgi:hypothetical protein
MPISASVVWGSRGVRISVARGSVILSLYKGWPEIQPDTVLGYQRSFEAAIKAIGTPLPDRAYGLSDAQAAAVIASVESTYYAESDRLRRPDDGILDAGRRFYPGPVVALVLAYLDATPEQRQRDFPEWAAAMATHVRAATIRDALDPMVSMMFKKRSKRFSS